MKRRKTVFDPIEIEKLINYLGQLLEPEKFQDSCPNGLQIAGKKEVKKIVTGVTACQALLDRAVAKKADMVLVHHGYFWNREDPRIVGMKYQRIKTLIKNDINLVGYHLCLDTHPIYGNNAQLAKLLNFQLESMTNDLLCIGRLNHPMNLDSLKDLITVQLDREPLVISGSKKIIKKIAWCSGEAQSLIEKAAAAGCDAYLSGEISEYTVHIARELGIDYIAAGHHATERYGIKALGEHLAEKFSIDCDYVEIDNPA